MNYVKSYVRRMSAWLAFSLLLSVAGVGQDRESLQAPAPQPGAVRIQEGTLLQIELAQRTDWKRVASNTLLEGRLLLPVFAGSDVAISQGTKVSLTIESVKKVGRDSGAWRKAGAAVLRTFNPLERGRPAEFSIRLSKTEIGTPQGSVAVAATALRVGYAGMVEPKIGRGGEVRDLQPSDAAARNVKKGQQTVILRLDEGTPWPVLATHTPSAAEEAARRKVHVFLLTQLSASHSRRGDVFQARLAEPLRVRDKLFEEGSIVEGKVSQSMPPRMLSRAGSLHLHIDRITSPEGTSAGVEGTLGGVEAEVGAKYALDEEGGLRGLKPGVANALVDLGIAYAVGKLSDDLAETPIRAIGAAMSDAAVANAARYFGLGASAAFLITRHGRDVYLPRYSEMEIDFGRLTE